MRQLLFHSLLKYHLYPEKIREFYNFLNSYERIWHIWELRERRRKGGREKQGRERRRENKGGREREGGKSN